LPDEVGRALERRDEIVWDCRRLVVVRELRLDEIEPALGSRVDDCVLDVVQRALRERREGTQRLDLVAEKLDAQRVAAGRREHVDEPPADRELASLLDTVDPLVPGKGESLREVVEPGRLGPAQDDRLGPRLRWRHRLGDGGGRRAHEPASGEDLERPRALADEVRRRLEPGAPVDAAARQQRHALVAQEPARPVGRVARIRVLRQKAHQAAAQLLVESREHEWQHRLRDARRGRQRLRIGAETLVGDQLCGERMKNGCCFSQVHDERRNRRFRALIVARVRGLEPRRFRTDRRAERPATGRSRA
jgi:hypothetical protein